VCVLFTTDDTLTIAKLCSTTQIYFLLLNGVWIKFC